MPEDEAAGPAPATGFPLIADVHEPEDLLNLVRAQGVPLEVQTLHPADFVVGDIGIERKSVRDFFNSLIRQRLFEQVTRLKETYPCGLLVLEGDVAYFRTLKNPGAFWGAYASISVDLGIPIIHTPTKEDTAAFLATLHRRESRAGRGAQVRFKPRSESLGLAARQKFAVQGLPRVGDQLSEKLLERFGSVRNIYLARERDLLKVPLIGKKTARDIQDFLDAPFQGTQRRLESVMGEEEPAEPAEP